MFQIGDKVVHPIYGAGTIKSIEERPDGPETQRYYVIPDTTEADRLLVPIENATRIGLRKVISADDASEVVKIIKSQGQALAPKAQDRVAYLKKVDWSDPFVVAELWRDLSSETKNGKVPAATEKVRQRARRLLLSEICLATGMSLQECGLMLDNGGKH